MEDQKMNALFAAATISSSQQKSPPTLSSDLPKSDTILFYDMYEHKKRDYTKLSSRQIPTSDVAKVAKNYFYYMLQGAQLKYINGHNGTKCEYKCKHCSL